jgi:hypothetical protein
MDSPTTSKPVRIPDHLQEWITARKRHRLSHAQVQMAREQFGQWIAGLPESEKTALLSRLAIDNEQGLRAELLRRYQHTRPPISSPTVTKSRAAGELLDEVERRERQRVAGARRREPQRRSAR